MEGLAIIISARPSADLSQDRLLKASYYSTSEETRVPKR